MAVAKVLIVVLFQSIVYSMLIVGFCCMPPCAIVVCVQPWIKVRLLRSYAGPSLHGQVCWLQYTTCTQHKCLVFVDFQCLLTHDEAETNQLQQSHRDPNMNFALHYITFHFSLHSDLCTLSLCSVMLSGCGQ